MISSVPQGRLDFTLPDFTRIVWVSDRAREIWEPRIAKICAAWHEVEWLSVVHQVRRCALTRIDPHELPSYSARAGRRGLSALALGVEGRKEHVYSATPVPYETGKPFIYALAIGRLDAVLEFETAWQESNHDLMGELLGFPVCCRTFFQRSWVEQRLLDTTWAMGANRTSAESDHRCAAVHPQSSASPVLRWLGVRLVPHLPCSFECAASAQLAAKMAKVGRENGFKTEMEWAEEMLQWDIEWDARHGIAEIRLPIAKIITRTDATADRYVVKIHGTRPPPVEQVAGLRFPFRKNKLPRLTKKPDLQVPGETPSAFNKALSLADTFTDNGFSTFRMMELAHDCIIQAAREILMREEGVVFDLGAGNGRLVSKLCEGTQLVPAGIEIDRNKVQRAFEFNSTAAPRLVVGDLFDFELWPKNQKIAGALLSIARLIEVKSEKAHALVDHLRKTTEILVLYQYDHRRTCDLERSISEFGLSRTISSTKGCASVALLRRPFA